MYLIRNIIILLLQHGRRRFAFVLVIVSVSAMSQAIGVASIIPFLAFASNPGEARSGSMFRWLSPYLTDMSDQGLVIAAGCLTIFGTMFANGLTLLRTYVLARYFADFSANLRTSLFEEILSRRYSYFLNSSSGILIKKINTDAKSLAQNLSSSILAGFSAFLTGVSILILLIAVDPVLTLVAFCVLTGTYLVAFVFFNRLRENTSLAMLRASRRANQIVYESLSAIKPIKLGGIEEAFTGALDSELRVAASFQARQAFVSSMPRNIVEPVAISIMIAVVIYAGHGEGLEDILPVIGLFAFGSFRMLPQLQTIYSCLSTISASGYVYDEVASELKPSWNRSNVISRSDVASGALAKHGSGNRIEVRDLCYTYPGSSEPVIADLNLTIPSGSSIAIIGRSGCGKSTLVDLLVGLYEPTSGSIFVDGDHLTEKQSCYRQCVGYVTQDIVLLDDTIVRNVALGEADHEIDWGRIDEAAKAAQLTKFIEEEAEDGWQTKVGERGIRLSGGQRQRIGIARALYRRPSLVILDEATSALDTVTESGVIGGIRALSDSVTTVIISHRPDTVQWCDQVLDLSMNQTAAAIERYSE